MVRRVFSSSLCKEHTDWKGGDRLRSTMCALGIYHLSITDADRNYKVFMLGYNDEEGTE